MEVVKAAFLKCVQKPSKVSWWFRSYIGSIPCLIVPEPKHQTTKAGFVWVGVRIPGYQLMKVQVPEDAVTAELKE